MNLCSTGPSTGHVQAPAAGAAASAMNTAITIERIPNRLLVVFFDNSATKVAAAPLVVNSDYKDTS
jgi:hypothetical protein